VFYVAGVANNGVSYFSGFGGFEKENSTKKIGYNHFRNFCSCFGLKTQVLCIVTESKIISFI
jgi:hypothetical protein